MIGEVNRAMAIRKGHACKIPEDEHETPFLVVHIPVLVRSDVGSGKGIDLPGCCNQLFTFRTRIGVQEVSQKDKSDFAANIAQSLILTSSSRER